MNVTRSQSPPSPSRGRRRTTIAALTIAVCLTGPSAVLTQPASADTGNFYSLESADSGYFLDVQGASTAAGAPIDVWPETDNLNQKFTYPAAGQIAEIVNQGSQMCVTTDGVAGDTLTQEPCTGSLSQYWYAQNVTPWWDFTETLTTLTNPNSGLVMDVYGGSTYPGAAVDAYSSNGGRNQEWDLPG